MRHISKREVIRYTVLPGFMPRLKELFASGFHYIPFFVALVYQTVRLLPAHHPYTKSENIGYFGLRAVVAEAASHLKFDRHNIDQIVLFFTILLGIVIIFSQFVLLGIALMAQPVMAAMPTNFAGFFSNAAPAQDLSYMFLDMVFGVPDMFNSCVADPAVACINSTGTEITNAAGDWVLQDLGWPTPLHLGLHQLFQVYSLALMTVGATIVFYFIATIVIETAQSGQAFGKRFNKIWAPFRIVMAFGLLIPMSNGLNSAQYIVLYAAKFGAAFATNGWNIFNTTLTGSYLNGGLVSEVNAPDLAPFMKFMFTVNTCARMVATESGGSQTIQLYAVKDPIATPSQLPFPVGTGGGSSGTPITFTQNYQSLINFLDGEDRAILRWGILDAKNYGKHLGYVKPICGEITLPLIDPRNPDEVANPEVSMQPNQAAVTMQAFYLYQIQYLWQFMETQTDTYPQYFVNRFSNIDPDVTAPLFDTTYKQGWVTRFNTDLTLALRGGGTALFDADPSISVDGAIQNAIDAPDWIVTTTDGGKGWAGAGMWYNRLAILNGTLAAATHGAPIITRYPWAMEYVHNQKLKSDKQVEYSTRFEPKAAGRDKVSPETESTQEYAQVLWAAYSYWDAGGGASSNPAPVSDNAFIAAIQALMGTSGLYDMRKNQDVHPLAQLVGVGRALVQSAINNFSGAAAFAGIGKAAKNNKSKIAAASFVSAMWTVGMIGLTVGFLLFYVIPFLPFIYFFFAVSGWIKGIFEAMVGAPLWALAHLKIDGHGLPGPAAVSGYFLIFEIFLRPILILFGLLASISIFSALVSVLNQTWDVVVVNLGGFDVQEEATAAVPVIEKMRGEVDQFFYTIIYAVIVYLMGMSSFKLIDLIPNQILRWMGQSVSSFNDSKEDAAKGLVSSAAIGAQQLTGTVAGKGKGLAEAIAKS